jgi:dethiobiotin synthetase
MAAFFVTGSGTDIGKTWISAQLLRWWTARGWKPEALKPVASGYDPSAPRDSDGAALLEALGRPVDAAGVEAIMPLRFAAPCRWRRSWTPAVRRCRPRPARC